MEVRFHPTTEVRWLSRSRLRNATIQEGKHVLSRWDGMGCQSSLAIFTICFFSVVVSTILVILEKMEKKNGIQ